MTRPLTLATARSSQSLSHAERGRMGLAPPRHTVFRSGAIAALALTIATLLIGASCFVAVPLVTSWWLATMPGVVSWDFDKTNWWQGGATSVSFGSTNFWFPRLTDGELKHLHNLHRVVSLNLAESDKITDGGLAALRGLDDLSELNLDRLDRYRHSTFGNNSAPLNDACLVQILALPRLERLALAGNLISDQGLAQIAKMARLKTLDLSATEVGDAGLVYLKQMTSLESVNLGATRVTSEGIAQLRMARPDLSIELDVEPAVEQAVNLFRGVSP